MIGGPIHRRPADGRCSRSHRQIGLPLPPGFVGDLAQRDSSAQRLGTVQHRWPAGVRGGGPGGGPQRHRTGEQQPPFGEQPVPAAGSVRRGEQQPTGTGGSQIGSKRLPHCRGCLRADAIQHQAAQSGDEHRLVRQAPGAVRCVGAKAGPPPPKVFVHSDPPLS